MMINDNVLHFWKPLCKCSTIVDNGWLKRF